MLSLMLRILNIEKILSMMLIQFFMLIPAGRVDSRLLGIDRDDDDVASGANSSFFHRLDGPEGHSVVMGK